MLEWRKVLPAAARTTIPSPNKARSLWQTVELITGTKILGIMKRIMMMAAMVLLAALAVSCQKEEIGVEDLPTFTAHADTSAIAIAYRPDTLSYRYTDTVWLPQVIVTETAPPAKRKIHWGAWAFWAVLVAALLRGIIKDTCPD